MYVYGGATYVSCREKNRFPIIEFLYGSYWMELRPEDYVMDDGYEDCFVCIFEEPHSSTMILGNSFLRGFYSTHDLSSNKFGFAAHATSSKADPRYGDKPEDYLPGTSLKKKLSAGAIVGIVAAVVLGGLGLGIGLWCCLSGSVLMMTTKR